MWKRTSVCGLSVVGVACEEMIGLDKSGQPWIFFTYLPEIVLQVWKDATRTQQVEKRWIEIHAAYVKPGTTFQGAGPWCSQLKMIQAIFYSEFDNIVGPVIKHQAPEGYLHPDVFESVSDYMIVEKQLCGKLITVQVFGLRIVGYAVRIEDDKYHRNALLFNIGLVFEEEDDTECFGPVLRKLGSIFEAAERESAFLSDRRTNESLTRILPRILTDLKWKGACVLPIDEYNMINLKVFPRLPDPPRVADHEVPVRIRDLDALLMQTTDWDLTLLQIIPFIDGINYVKKIAIDADVDIGLVRTCLQQMIYHGTIVMIDLFQYSNIYATTKDISVLAEDKGLQKQCAQFITKDGHQFAPFSKIFALYCSVQPGLRVSDFCNLYSSSLHSIDIRRFFTFGVVYRLLRRVHRYLLWPNREHLHSQMPSNPASEIGRGDKDTVERERDTQQQKSLRQSSQGSLERNHFSRSVSNMKPFLPVADPPEVNLVELREMMNGCHNSDEICVRFMKSYTQINSIIPDDCVAVHK